VPRLVPVSPEEEIMVTRTVGAAPRGVAVLCIAFQRCVAFVRHGAGLALTLAAAALAQSPAAEATAPPPAPAAQQPAPAAPQPAPAASPSGVAGAAVATGLTYGRIVVERAALRCWTGAVAQPPAFDEALTKDTVVVLGRSEQGFRCVHLPLGPVGFVSKKFTESTPEGAVKTKGVKVAFRYRPKSSEAPVSQLENGTALHVISEQDDWYRVRVPGVEAWVAEAEVQATDAADPAPARLYAELQQKHEGEVKARLDAIAAQLERQRQDAADVAAVQRLQEDFLVEQKKPIAEQKYAAITEAVDKLQATFAADSAGKPVAAALKQRIDQQSWIVDATPVVREVRSPVNAAPPPEKKDPLERFQSIGWLRYERRIAGPGVYYLDKGGQRQYEVACSNGRYDLGLFVDCEVAVLGPRRRPVTTAMTVIDVERLEVLGVAEKR
jgi:SH3-like domain-containing protein